MSEVRCSEDGCPVPDGQCALGHELLADCPNVEFSALPEPPPAVPTHHQFHHGFALTDDEAFILSCEHPPSIVLLVGLPDVGKTTLIAGVHEAFRLGPLGGTRFAGSRTLLGLEERCHLSRMSSGAASPDTARTAVNAPERFLHVRVQEVGKDGSTTDILIVDVSGEDFANLVNSGQPGGLRPVFGAATDVVLLADAAGLGDDIDRHATATSLRRLTRAVHELGLVSGDVRLQLVTTKHDLVEPGADHTFCDELIAELTEKWSELTPHVTYHSTAMRANGDWRAGDGLAGLLDVWRQPRSRRHHAEAPAVPPRRESHRFASLKK